MTWHPANPDYHLRHGTRVLRDPMTAIYVGLSVVGAASQASAAKQQAKATIQQGNIASANRAQEIARKAATQRVSFLNSGLTLEGTPMNVIESTFNTGLQDLNQISSNYNKAAKNQISAGRSAALSSLASSFSGIDFGGGGGGANFGNGFGFLGPSQAPAPVEYK